MKLLSYTYPKSACPSLSLPAITACPAYAASMAMALQRNAESICGDCYACKGRFRFPNVRKAHLERLRWWRQTAPRDRALILADEVRRAGSPAYFRAYASGDLGEGDDETWLHFVELLPQIKIWMPTRTWILPRFLPALRQLNAHDQIVVRPSAVAFDDPPPVVPGLAAGHASHHKHKPKANRVCPGDCSTCRLCWNQPETSVSFRRH